MVHNNSFQFLLRFPRPDNHVISNGSDFANTFWCSMIWGPVELTVFSTSFFSIPSSHFLSSVVLQFFRAPPPLFFLEEKDAGEKNNKKSA